MNMRLYLLLFAANISLFSCNEKKLSNPQFRYNAQPEELAGIQKHSPFSTLVLRTAAPRLTFTAMTTYSRPYLAHATVTAFVEDKYIGTYTLQATGREESFTLDFHGKGEREVQLTEGGQQNALEKSTLEFTSITSVEVPSGYSYTIPAVIKKTEGIFIFGDSRTQGAGYSDGGRYAWPVQLRRLRPASDIYVGGYSSLQLAAHINTPQLRMALTQEITAALRKYPKQVLWVEAGVNDYFNAVYTPAQFQVFYRLWLQELHRALPKLRIVVQTDVVRKDESANKLGFTLQDERNAEEAAGAGLPYVHVQDGRPLTTVTQLPDGTHLSSEADAQFAAEVDSILDIATNP